MVVENQTARIQHLRVLHTSDLHLGGFENGHTVMEALVKTAVDTNVALVVIAGDLFDSNYVSDNTVNLALEHLYKLMMPVVILPGNHDCLVPDSVYNRKEFLKVDQHIHIYRRMNGEEFLFPDLGLVIWGKPINDYVGDLRPLGGIPFSGSQEWHIAVAHGLFVGSDNSTGRSFQISKEEIVSSGMDYVALGHWPSLKSVCEMPIKAYYSGAFSETGVVLIVDLTVTEGVRVLPHRAILI